MTYSAWTFKDAAHIHASTSAPQLLHHDQQHHHQQRPTPPPAPVPLSPHLPSQHAHRHCLPICLTLGVNRTTGRLQWCPGCRYAKIMLLLPVVLTPVVLVLLLFSHLDSAAGSVRHQQQQQQQQQQHRSPANALDASGEDTDRLLLLANHVDRGGDDTRCTAIRYSLSETPDSEERDLRRDVRTSFIPPAYVYASPDCVRARGEAGGGVADAAQADYDDVDRMVALPDSDDIGEVFDSTDDGHGFDYRRRREAVTSDRNATLLTDMWQTLKNAVEHLQGIEPEPVTANPAEGTAEQIRNAQSELMLQYMDPTMNPCTDFYQYACGNWARLNAMPKDKGAYDTFEMLREKLDHILRELLSEPLGQDVPSAQAPHNAEQPDGALDATDGNNVKLAGRRLRRGIYRRRAELRVLLDRRRRRRRAAPSDTMNAEDKAKLMYQTCMEHDTLEERGVQPLVEFLRSLGGWPALTDSWNATQFDWLNLTATLRQYNNDILLVLWVGADIKNSNENVIQFDQTNLGLPTRDYFLEPSNAKYLAAYVQFIRTTLECLGASAERAALEADDIVGFETELARIMTASEARINISLLYNKLSLSELRAQIPQIDWTHYLSVVQGRDVNEAETVVMYAMEYMKNLVKLIDRSNGRSVSNYLLWRFVRHRINNLDDRFLAAKQRFFFVLFGREESPERWKTCVSHVNTNMGMAVGAMFVRRYFDETSKRDTLEMTQELQQAFRVILNTTEWLDGPTRHFAELKVNAMQLRIGYPDFILQRDALNAKFEALRIERGEYFENTLRVLRHIARVDQGRLGEAINRTEWNTAPAIINAYYSRNKNQIMFPAGILQPPFYHRHFPRALNFGGIGVVIGHELTHGFDDKGRLFDMDGNMLRWWSNSAVEGFHKRAQCLVAQYGNFTVPDVPGLMVNGESTQGENIADNGGLKQSYRAYSRWLDGQPDQAAAEEAERMPGMEDWTGRKLFFLNFAQVWCGAMRPEAAMNKLKTTVHSPGMYRVIGTLRNSEEFAQVFGCAAGTPMNPVEKCRVW